MICHRVFNRIHIFILYYCMLRFIVVHKIGYTFTDSEKQKTRRFVLIMLKNRTETADEIKKNMGSNVLSDAVNYSLLKWTKKSMLGEARVLAEPKTPVASPKKK